MNKLTLGGAILALVLCIAPAPAQTQLAWKFSAGDSLAAVSEMNMKQTVKVLGMDQNIDTKMTMTVTYAVKAVNGDEVQFEQTFDGTKVEGNPFAGMMEESLDKLKGQKISFTLNTKTNEVVKLDGVKEMVKKLTDDNPQMAQMMGSIMNEDAMKHQLAAVFTFLPKKAVNKGDTWERASAVPLGPMGSFKTKETFTYEGAVDKDGKKLEKIVATGTMTYVTPKEKDPKDNNPLPFEIVKADFKGDEMKMTYYFDNAAGRLHSSEAKNKFKGAMTISAQGMEISMEMEQEQEAKTKIQDKKSSK